MPSASCHCGAVRIAIPALPDAITNCNCSVCRRYAALWGYFDAREVRVDTAPSGLERYERAPKTLAFMRCAQCGNVTHWRPTRRPDAPHRMGVNMRLFDEVMMGAGPQRVRLLDGATSERYLGECILGE